MSTFTTFAANLFPNKCILCKMLLRPHEQHCCTTCIDYLPYISLGCGKCNSPLTTTAELCGYCLTTERHWELCISPFAYIDPLPKLIHALKYQNKTHTINFFIDSIIAATNDSAAVMPDFLTYIPSHPLRFIERGYNQSLILTQALSKKTNIPYIGAFEKVKTSRQQSKLNRKERIKEPKHTFRLKSSSKKDIQEKHITIIDDVVTTGSTTSELARIIKKAGAVRVDVWSIART